MKTKPDTFIELDARELGWLAVALRDGCREFVEEVEVCGSVLLPLGIWWGWSADGLARFVACWLAGARPRVATWPPVALRWNLPPPPPPKRSGEPPVWDCSN